MMYKLALNFCLVQREVGDVDHTIAEEVTEVEVPVPRQLFKAAEQLVLAGATDISIIVVTGNGSRITRDDIARILREV